MLISRLRSAATAALVALPVLAVTPARAAMDFNININSITGFTEAQEGLVDTAVEFWESVITGYQVDFDIAGFDGIDVDFVIEDIDGAGVDGRNTIARAGPRTGFLFDNVDGAGRNIAYAATGQVTFDSFDIAPFGAGQTFLDVIVHELAHVLGFGTLWSFTSDTTGVLYNDVLDQNGNYDGLAGLAAYRLLDPDAQFIPTDDVNGHWAEEGTALGSNELLTPLINPENFVDPVTIATFIDLGYTVQFPTVAAVPVPAAFPLMLTALGFIGFAGWRRRR